MAQIKVKATCSTCKHWKASADGSKSGECRCTKIASDDMGRVASPDVDGAIYTDGDYNCTFTTGPDFGCIHHF